MKTNDQLHQAYDESLFAVYMDRVMAQDGEQFLRENQELRENCTAQDQMQMDAVFQTLMENCESREKQQTVRRKTKAKVRVAVAFAAVLMLLLTTVCARTPLLQDLKQTTVIEERDGFMGFYKTPSALLEFPEQILGCTIPAFPEGFSCVTYTNTKQLQKIELESGQQSITISVSVYDASAAAPASLEDVPDASVELHGLTGQVYRQFDEYLQQQTVRVIAADTAHERLIEVHGVDVDAETLIALTEQIQYVGEKPTK